MVALIAGAGVSILTTAFWGDGPAALGNTSWVMVAIFAAAFLLLKKGKAGPILVMVLAGVAKVLAAVLFAL